MIGKRWSQTSHPAIRHPVARARRALALLCALWTCSSLAPAEAVQAYPESAVKAAFVLRFAGYVEWPQTGADADPLRIAVLGDPAITAHLEDLAANRIIAGREVQVRRVPSVAAAKDAQVLVMGSPRPRPLEVLLRPLAGSSVLVVTDEEDALQSGSVINFVKEANRLRFEVSLPAARRMGLRISSELLSVAAVVQR